jgi:hypothetical protein
VSAEADPEWHRVARLRINHSLPDAPKYLLFLACDPDELKATLSAARFEVFEANAGRELP